MPIVKSEDQVLLSFVAQAKSDFEKALRILTERNTLSASQTFQFYVRVPNQQQVVALNPPDLWKGETEASAVVATFDGEIVYGPESAKRQGSRYAAVFEKNPEVNVVLHVHTPYLGGWASSHRVLPLLYAASQRHTLARELPVYIDRTGGEPAFINATIAANPHTPAILEANGGSTLWGKNIIAVSKFLLLLEEGVQFQAIAESLGGSKEFGPGVLEQQWSMGFVKKTEVAA